ncbi:MAG: chemotaxis protein [Burkholderiaceae bacterium]|nr:chemotaxis protein [Burkholderiaceae bacterium]
MAIDDPKVILAKKADRVFLPILWLLLLLSFVLSKQYGTTYLTLTVGLPLAAIPSALIFLKPGAFITRAAVAIALMLFCALHIHQAMGVAEYHFGIFVLLAFLLCYQDWRVIIVAAAVAAVHHLSFNYLQQLGYNTICFTEPGMGKVLIHAAYVVAEAGVLAYLAIVLDNENTKAESSNKSLQSMLATAQQISDQVQTDINALTNTSRGIALASTELATQISAQAQGLRSASASMGAFSATAHDTANALLRADQLIATASTLAACGGDSVKNVVTSMETIDTCSTKIVDIVSLIDGFTFQMNILALNASVEAANAGSHGKGFAVVATEVRALAQRSAIAAKDIRQLVETTVNEVKAGGQLVEKAGIDMDSIVSAVKQVAELTLSITQSGQAQSQDISAINGEISQLDQMTHKNMALIQQMEQATNDLYSHTSHVSGTVARLHDSTEKTNEVRGSDEPNMLPHHKLLLHAAP